MKKKLEKGFCDICENPRPCTCPPVKKSMLKQVGLTLLFCLSFVALQAQCIFASSDKIHYVENGDTMTVEGLYDVKVDGDTMVTVHKKSAPKYSEVYYYEDYGTEAYTDNLVTVYLNEENTSALILTYSLGGNLLSIFIEERAGANIYLQPFKVVSYREKYHE